ncbi:Uncharacterised protein [Salmonella enterica subsp. enterica]|uniref:Uncharacterized protein n=1 Tax=Salmonella enterica I TaxID=59201 RepID=A0A379WS74_SALET|nr:Uncharacterised protein [Salmonella enterica subsp. enterica]
MRLLFLDLYSTPQHKVWGVIVVRVILCRKFLPRHFVTQINRLGMFHGNGLSLPPALTGDGQHIFRCRERHLPIMKRQAALLRQIGPRGPTRSYRRPLAGKLFQPLADPFRFQHRFRLFALPDAPAHHAGIPPSTLRPSARQSRRVRGSRRFTPRALRHRGKRRNTDHRQICP